MDENNTRGALTLDMLEKAIEIAAGNFGAPDSLMISDDAFSNLRNFFDPEYMAKHEFNETMKKLHWPNRYPRIYKLEDLLGIKLKV